LREVPPLINRILARANWTKENTDHFVLHQANRFLLNHLAKKMGIPYAKAPIALDEFGNTSSASIPLAMTHCLRQGLAQKKLRLVLAGFGVGLSWGAAALELGPIELPELEIVP
jgi:3-oxoacyl-[acyl-carrier-protein] synthase-3